jgi:anti-sigma regulatory factor (Ser/Thr protein kinase)
MAREPAMNPAASGGGPQASAVLPGVPESARRARAVVTRTLGHDHPAAPAAASCVSELAANAISHTRSGQPGGTFTVSVHDGGDTVRIAVTDAGSTARPRVRRPRPASTRGRGLALVAALSAAWGYQRTGGGQLTWCHISASGTTAA